VSNFRFAYSGKLNHPKEEDLSGDSADSVTLTPENTLTPREIKKITFPLTVKNEAQLMQISRQLSTIDWKRNKKYELPPPFLYSYNGAIPSVVIAEETEAEEFGGAKDLKRSKSVPILPGE